MKKIAMMLLAGSFIVSGCTIYRGDGSMAYKIQPKGWNRAIKRAATSRCKGNFVLSSKGEYDKTVTISRKDRNINKWYVVKQFDLGPASTDGNAYYEQRRGGYNEVLMVQYHEIWLNLKEAGSYRITIAPFYENLFEKRRYHNPRAKNTWPFRPNYDEPPRAATYSFTIGEKNNRPHILFRGCWVDVKIDTLL